MTPPPAATVKDAITSASAVAVTDLNMATMAHKIHSGKLLKSKEAKGGEDYTNWGYQNTKAN